MTLHNARAALSVCDRPHLFITSANVDGAAAGEAAEVLLAYLIDQALAPYWHSVLTQAEPNVNGPVLDLLLNGLKAARVSSVMSYLVQREATRVVIASLDRVNVECAVMKGAHLREWVYSDAALRLSADVDVLISPLNRMKAIKALLDCGFTLEANTEIVSHEATLSRAGAHIDLHWDIMRPGRTRVPLCAEFLSRRVQRNGLWTLSDTDAVFLMLVHPAFTKYVCSPLMTLNRALDFVLLVQSQVVDWDGVIDLLEKTGTKTAAWAVLTWFVMVSPPHIHDLVRPVIARIEPGSVRKRYLTYWLVKNLPTRFFEHPSLIKFGFTLPLHDTLPDVWRALAAIRHARRMAASDPVLMLMRDGQQSVG